ncbi:MAG: 4Fe-4S binding protein, partial [Methylococcales bacterium]
FWVHTKYYLLGFILVSSAFGVLTAGYFSAIPVITRGFLFSLERLQRGLLRGFHELGAVDWTFYLSLILFLGVLCLSLIEKRFWCRYVCPTGAVFSFFNFFRLTERKVDDTCIHCTKCVQICPFDAISEDFNTRTSDCTLCQSCGGVCPTYSIQFVPRWKSIPLKPVNEPLVTNRPVSRRGFLTAGVAATGVALMKWEGLLDIKTVSAANRPIRPPGSVAEAQFLDLCIRCGECFKVCPGPVLHPAGIDYGLDSMWTPEARMTHAACDPECNFCTQVCPTGAIQPLALPVKRKTIMGLAKINERTCFPHAGAKDCQLCYDECVAAGYDAIKMKDIELSSVEENAPPADLFGIASAGAMATIRAPFIDPDACVGCGLCEYRCHKAFVEGEHSLATSAITVSAENDGRI